MHRVGAYEKVRHVQADIKVGYGFPLNLVFPCLEGFGMRPLKPQTEVRRIICLFPNHFFEQYRVLGEAREGAQYVLITTTLS
jgi:hypothetical protein